MAILQDYYAILGVPRNASISEIKQAYVAKRIEYQGDEEMSIQVNVANDTLSDEEKRRKYDIALRHGEPLEDVAERLLDEINELWEKYNECSDERDEKNYLLRLKTLYEEYMPISENALVSWKNLFYIEDTLGNRVAAIRCLRGADDYATNSKDTEKKLACWQWLSKQYQEMGLKDDAFRVYQNIYQADISYVDEVIELVRCHYDGKGDLRTAVQILGDCIGRAVKNVHKVSYICEFLRVLHKANESSYAKLESNLYDKLRSFRSDGKAENLQISIAIIEYMDYYLDEKDFAAYHRMEEVFHFYYNFSNLEDPELRAKIDSVLKFAKALEDGKIHEVIQLLVDNEVTAELKKKLGELVFEDLDGVKQSIDFVKKNLPQIYEDHIKGFAENVIDTRYDFIREARSMQNDKMMNSDMKAMLRFMCLDWAFRFEDIEDEFFEVRDSFFSGNKASVNETLRDLSQFYPNCFKQISDIFFDGKGISEIVGPQRNSESSMPIHVSTSTSTQHTNQSDAEETIDGGWRYLGALFYLALVVVFPPVGIAVLLRAIISKFKPKNQESEPVAKVRTLEECDQRIEDSGGKLSAYFGKLFFCLEHERFRTAIGVLFTILFKKLRFLLCIAAAAFCEATELNAFGFYLTEVFVWLCMMEIAYLIFGALKVNYWKAVWMILLVSLNMAMLETGRTPLSQPESAIEVYSYWLGESLLGSVWRAVVCINLYAVLFTVLWVGAMEKLKRVDLSALRNADGSPLSKRIICLLLDIQATKYKRLICLLLGQIAVCVVCFFFWSLKNS